MRIDQNKINELCAMSDEALWAEIVKMAAEHGFTLPVRAPSHADMEKIRGAASGGTRLNLSSALKIINDYRKSAK